MNVSLPRSLHQLLQRPRPCWSSICARRAKDSPSRSKPCSAPLTPSQSLRPSVRPRTTAFWVSVCALHPSASRVRRFLTTGLALLDGRRVAVVDASGGTPHARVRAIRPFFPPASGAAVPGGPRSLRWRRSQFSRLPSSGLETPGVPITRLVPPSRAFTTTTEGRQCLAAAVRAAKATGGPAVFDECAARHREGRPLPNHVLLRVSPRTHTPSPSAPPQTVLVPAPGYGRDRVTGQSRRSNRRRRVMRSRRRAVPGADRSCCARTCPRGRGGGLLARPALGAAPRRVAGRCRRSHAHPRPRSDRGGRRVGAARYRHPAVGSGPAVSGGDAGPR